MISYAEIFNWLNFCETTSSLSPKSRFSIWQIIDPKFPDSQKDAMIDALVNSTRAIQDENEVSEVLVFAGKAQAERGRLIEAQRYLGMSFSRYNQFNDEYRSAVVKLLLSYVFWQMGDLNSAYAAAKYARDLFEKILALKRQELQDARTTLPGRGDCVIILEDRVNQIIDDWIEQPEEAFHWLNRFGESYLSEASKQFRETIIQRVIRREFYRVYEELDELQEMTQSSLEPNERAEVMAFCGLTYYQMGNAREAEKFLRLSAAHFPPDRHHQTVVRWMQAMVIAKDRGRVREAVRIANDAVRCLEALQLDADQHNRAVQCSWYEQQAANTRRVIKKLVERL
jgi:tetratricopeptide (TPR) repeat protein